MFTTQGNIPAKARLTWSLLYVIFPAIAGGVGLSVLRLHYLRRPLAALREAFAGGSALQDLKTVFRFKDTAQVTCTHATWGAGLRRPRRQLPCPGPACKRAAAGHGRPRATPVAQPQVEMLSRVMRKWDADGIPDPEDAAFGEFIIKVCPLIQPGWDGRQPGPRVVPLMPARLP